MTTRSGQPAPDQLAIEALGHGSAGLRVVSLVVRSIQCFLQRLVNLCEPIMMLGERRSKPDQRVPSSASSIWACPVCGGLVAGSGSKSSSCPCPARSFLAGGEALSALSALAAALRGGFLAGGLALPSWWASWSRLLSSPGLSSSDASSPHRVALVGQRPRRGVPRPRRLARSRAAPRPCRPPRHEVLQQLPIGPTRVHDLLGQLGDALAGLGRHIFEAGLLRTTPGRSLRPSPGCSWSHRSPC